tara:strand:- start:4238 stop:6313 length:2076 start_codon:yes stop_codon:yes gene_type:complete
LNLTDSVSIIKGVGPQREKVFNNLGVFFIRDILYYFPRRHLDRSIITPISKLKVGNNFTVIADLKTFGLKKIRRGNMFQAIVSDGTGLLTLNWFNGVRYIKNLFKVGDKLTIYGKVEWYNGFAITHPEFEKLLKDEDPILTGNIIPIYPLTNELKSSGLDQRGLRNILKEVLNNVEEIVEILPIDIIKKNNLIDLNSALHAIHFASGINELRFAKKRLKFDEHFFLQLLLVLRKQSLRSLKAKRLIDIGPYFRRVSNNLNFELTNAQKNVVQEVHLDMKHNYPMNRLIQGDVGSGKTIVAILISALAIGNNVQVAIMVPTEILARQHFYSFKEHLEKVNIECALLIGKMKKSERKSINEAIKNGNIDVVIGTHALIQDDIFFKELGLVIIDEQHRFGVNQRSALLDKGNNPHFMSMTATPIPRTLSITYHGDMDLSIIDELPAHRIPVVTKVVEPNRMNKVYNFIRNEVSLGKQCIVVYPLVEESEKLDLAAAVEAYNELSSIQFSTLEVGLVHGKMNSEEKTKIIRKFEKNKINILVSTTVIEVGIDIPNATIMLIEHAERFGLTQLHQLRGRVGRGTEKSYCILVKRNFADISNIRLSIMEKINDGFEIADEDLSLRGPGEFFGSKQSGFFQYKIANMVTDTSIIKNAREAAMILIKKDSNLTSENNQKLKNCLINDYSQYLGSIKLSS